ncbi:hypothetical protein [Reinekea blandensis]|uniref:hypothetical protein n=1 Tax=Reinekea blandensis TaxID=374838 RepID=UPI00031C6506|nr:hypothetical protein [Reinekea blandensis]
MTRVIVGWTGTEPSDLATDINWNIKARSGYCHRKPDTIFQSPVVQSSNALN